MERNEQALIMPVALSEEPHAINDMVMCTGCGVPVFKKWWDTHAGTHQDFQEVVEVLRSVSDRMFGPQQPGTLSDQIEKWFK